MGCASSISKRNGGGGVGMLRKKRMSSVPVVAVFVPSLRVPVGVDLIRPLRGLVPRGLLEKLSGLRTRIVTLAEHKTISVVQELQRALEEYLPVLLGLTNKVCRVDDLEFKWRNVEGDGKETCFASAWYEVMSVVHLMAMLTLVEANMLLVPLESPETCGISVSEESKKNAVDLLLKASGYLDYCINHIMDHLSLQIRYNLPCDMQEGALEAISLQSLGQVLEMQLGLACECENATLSVKRRLACEALNYFAQAHYCLSGCATDDHYGKKHQLFIKWKYLEAKAAAYFYHGLVLDKQNGPKENVSAVTCLLAAEDLLRESKKSCLSFCLAGLVSRVPPAWGVMKHLHKKVPDVAYAKYQMYAYHFDQEIDLPPLPELPEFSLSLKPDDFELPDIDASWDDDMYQAVVQSLKEHLNDDD